MEYLTEKNLIELFRTTYEDLVCNKNFFDRKFRPDIRIDSIKLVVEFDGYLHYTDSKTIMRDTKKDIVIQEYGYKIVRVPYFVQLKHLENLLSNYISLDVIRNFKTYGYKSGFIDNKAKTPADFCSLGLKRFYKDIEFYNCSKEIIESLKLKDTYEAFSLCMIEKFLL